jgi:integrase
MKHINDYLEKPDIDRILDIAKIYNYRDYLIILVLWHSGMRASELLSITPATIEWQNNVVNVINGKGGKIGERTSVVKPCSFYVNMLQRIISKTIRHIQYKTTAALQYLQKVL